MDALKEKICREGKVLEGDVLRVDSFLNHQIDVGFLGEMGREFYRLYCGCGVNKILTVESSGIGIACVTAQFFNCPVVVAKKSKSSNMSSDVYVSGAWSYTHGNYYDITVSRDYIKETDCILVIDDFLAKGNALHALLSIIRESGAKLAGAGIVIEKAYQGGGDEIRAAGVRIESLASIASMSVAEGIVFC